MANRSALFVDFDNIYLGLKQSGTGGEVEFAQNPGRWLRWLETRLETLAPSAPADAAEEGEDEPGDGRRILVRRCYLNPRSFYRSRPFFIRAGFEVVDTPALTAQGKTSADVQMALDMVDALHHTTRFDEFILFSADADFTPVLRRLREHDRRTVVLTTGPTAAAYRSVCDLLVDEERFLEEALGLVDEVPSFRRPPGPVEEVAGGDVRDAPRPSVELLERIGDRVRDLAQMTGGIQAVHLPGVYKEFREFSQGEDWLGFYSLQAMTEAVVEVTPGLALRGDDPWWVGLATDQGVAEAADGGAPGGVSLDDGEWERLGAFVRGVVAESERPVPLATLAQRVTEEMGDAVRAFDWRGTGSFKELLETLDLDPIRISEAETGYIFDPRCHGDPVEGEERDRFAEERPGLARFARTIHELTDTPYLAPEEYAAVLEETAGEIERSGFHMSGTSKAVRDRCYGRGFAVPRAAITFLLKGLSYSGYPLDREGGHTPHGLGDAVVDNTLTLCRRAQMDVGEVQEEMLRRWMLGEVDAAPRREEDLPEQGSTEGLAAQAGSAAR